MPSTISGLTTGQIAAIVVSVVAGITLLISLAAGVRYFVIRRRRSQVVEPTRNQKYGASPDSTVSQAKRGCAYGYGRRDSVAESLRSSIWGDIGCSAMEPVSTFSGDVLDSRLWPLPPGHSERYTFFSERSSTSVDDTLEIERWSMEDGDRDEVIREHNPTIIVRGSETRDRGRISSDSVWGISARGMK